MSNGKPALTRGDARRKRQSGFTYITALFAVAVAGLMLASMAELWSHSRQREKERELIWIGDQFRQAIALYYQRTPGAVKRYPEKLEDLMEDRRYLNMQRYLRQIYNDPMTGKAEWSLIQAPGGGIMGVKSLSNKAPIKTAGFRPSDNRLEGASRYSDWKFVYEPPATPQQR